MEVEQVTFKRFDGDTDGVAAGLGCVSGWVVAGFTLAAIEGPDVVPSQYRVPMTTQLEAQPAPQTNNKPSPVEEIGIFGALGVLGAVLAGGISMKIRHIGFMRRKENAINEVVENELSGLIRLERYANGVDNLPS